MKYYLQAFVVSLLWVFGIFGVVGAAFGLMALGHYIFTSDTGYTVGFVSWAVLLVVSIVTFVYGRDLKREGERYK